MNFEPKDFMTDAQKKEVGEAITKKLLEGISALQFSKGQKINLAPMVAQEITAMFENDDVYEQLNFKKIADRITAKVTDGI